jgi:predicted Zn-dependent protease
MALARRNMPDVIRLLILATVLSLAVCASAEPHIPRDDGAVLERLPEKLDPSLRQMKQMRIELNARPDDLNLAARLARRAIEAARETGDPRFLGQAQAALAPWWALSDPPAAALLLRATLRQSTHDFPGALTDLDRLISAQPSDGQALLTRATVLTVVGRYAEARADCARIAPLTTALVTAACDAAPMSLNGDAGPAYIALTRALDRSAADAGVREWALTLAAEIAARRGDIAGADRHFRDALAIDSRDPYLQGAYADFLIEHERAAEVVPLLKDGTRNDSLLLRLALAEAQLPDHRADFDAHRADLAARFDAARRRGDSLHRREEARYTLVIAGDPKAAVVLARKNWEVQREPADLRILVSSAAASGDAAALQDARSWAQANRLEDVAIDGPLERKP